MDFKPGILQTFPSNIPLPFYMTYPDYLSQEQKNTVLRDMEYLQQTYPNEVKRYQRKVAEILDKLDYEGSMIYDEYPDRYSIARLARTIVRSIRRETEEAQENKEVHPEKWEWMEDMIQVLLCNEIYKRRHGGRRGILKF